MDWLFGYKKEAVISENAEQSDGELTKSTMDAYRFDSTALERAAKAARDLERSKHSKEALELSKLQEATKQQENLTRLKEFEAKIETAKVEQKRIDYEEKRKNLEEETKQHQIRAQYQDQLSRKRYEEQLAMQKQAQEKQLRAQEESVAKQEAIRKSTIEHEIELKEKHKIKTYEAKALAYAKAERENRDVKLEQIKLKSQESRMTLLEGMKTAGNIFGDGLNTIFTDPNKAVMLVGTISAIALGIYTAKGATSVTTRYIESILTKPVLIYDTSKFSLMDCFKHPIITAKQFVKRFRKNRDIMQGVILHPKMEEKLRDVALETKNTKKNGGMFRNYIMYGPPGTGKTLFAKKLAMFSGMDYAIMTGGDVGPMGRDAVTAIHKVFDWSKRSRKGVVLFMDEADAFLRKRSSEKISEELRSAINAFLYRTSEQNNKFMLVLASNTPQQFDSAIHDRVDKMIEFGLPGLNERDRLLRFYFCKFVLQPASKGNTRLKVEHFDYGIVCRRLAGMSEGMSGRAISKLGVAWQAAAYSSRNGMLTEKMIVEVFEEALKDHRKKMEWLSDEEKYKGMKM